MSDAPKELADTLWEMAQAAAARAIIEYHENSGEAVRKARDTVERWNARAQEH